MTSSTISAWRISLRTLVLIATSLFVLTLAGLLASHAYYGMQNLLFSASNDAIQHISVTLEEKIQRIIEPAENQIRLLVHDELVGAHNLQQRLTRLPVIQEAIDSNPLLDAIYCGYENGEFILFRPLRSQAVREKFHAPPNSALLVQSISLASNGQKIGRYHFYSAEQTLIQEKIIANYQFDPRQRSWYQEARSKADTVLTEPYLFFTTQNIGITLAKRNKNANAVIGLDAVAADLASHLEHLTVTPNTELALVDSTKRVIAYRDINKLIIVDSLKKVRLAQVDELQIPVLTATSQLIQTHLRRQRIELFGREWETIAIPLQMQQSNRPLIILIAIPSDELFAEAHVVVKEQMFLALSLLMLSLLLGWWIMRRISLPLERLVKEAVAINRFDFSQSLTFRSHLLEVDQLALATQQMKNTIAHFLETSVALGSETELEKLLDTVLQSLLGAVNATQGAVYFADDQLILSVARSQGIALADIPEDAYLALKKQETIISISAHETAIFTPLLTRSGQMVGVLQTQFIPMQVLQRDDPQVRFIQALASTVAVAIETRHLIRSQQDLLEAFIQVLAAAIDAKSPYTAGHCQRVPQIATLLAEAASVSEMPPFAQFQLNENDRQSLHLGAWLHDCGKITTPEYVIDKATKLETLYNRIHEIRLRFEICKRDVEIVALKAQLNPEQIVQIYQEIQAAWQNLDNDFAFVAACNQGSFLLDNEKKTRLKNIAARTWQRTLDNRLGLSWEEAQRLPTSSDILPVTENLLADKPEHLIVREKNELIARDNPWGFRVQIPKYKFNRGELYNLLIERGTLTEEERYIINDHMAQTIFMLDKLPLPGHLRAVPEIAGGHHEKIDGSGYPRGLTGGEMSILAKIMAIADIFEALTANDRPYKRPNTLSQALGILVKMAQENHIDADLLALFIQSGAYREYGQCYLQKNQCDEVDEIALLSTLATLHSVNN